MPPANDERGAATLALSFAEREFLMSFDDRSFPHEFVKHLRSESRAMFNMFERHHYISLWVIDDCYHLNNDGRLVLGLPQDEHLDPPTNGDAPAVAPSAPPAVRLTKPQRKALTMLAEQSASRGWMRPVGSRWRWKSVWIGNSTVQSLINRGLAQIARHPGASDILCITNSGRTAVAGDAGGGA